MTRRAVLAALVLSGWIPASRASAQAPPPSPSPWPPVPFLAGEWEGESDGQPGKGTVKRSYRFVLGDKFLEEESVSTYPPQPRNPKGEVHQHRSFFSYDRARRTLVFRQFHQEGFVNQYAMVPQAKAGTVVFESEALENVPSGWKARETYEASSAEAFVETFEIARGGGAYEVYSQARFTRAHPGSVALAKELEAARFLLGDWRGEGGGKPGAAAGDFAFAPGLQGRVIVRTSSAEYPATAEKAAYRHDDLMVLYAGERGGLRADYYDSEGHVIRYAGGAAPDGGLTLTSDVVSGAPRFLLSYRLAPDGLLTGGFEIAPPGKPDAFAPYLAWTARRRKD